MDFQKMRSFSLRLLEWHGGQCSSLYCVGSSLLDMAQRGRLDDSACWALLDDHSGKELNTFELAEQEICRQARDEENNRRLGNASKLRILLQDLRSWHAEIRAQQFARYSKG